MFKFLCITVRDGSGPLLFPPPRFVRVPCSPEHLARLLSLFVLFASSPSINAYSAAPLQQRLVFYRPSVRSLHPTGWRPTKVFSWFPVQRPNAGLYPPPRPVRLVVLGLGVVGGAKETAPPVLVLSPSTRPVGVGRESVPSSTLEFPIDTCGDRLSVCPPPPPPFAVQPYVSLYSPS